MSGFHKVRSHRIDFDPVTHTYLVDGVAVPSVTTILSRLSITSYRLSGRRAVSAMASGASVHEACAAVMKQAMEPWLEVDRSGWSLDLSLRADRWAEWVEANVDECVAVEDPISMATEFAGTPDAIVRLRDGRVALIEIKAGRDYRHYQLQVAGYELAVEYTYGRLPDVSMIAYVSTDIAKVVELSDDARRREVFLSALEVWKWITE